MSLSRPVRQQILRERLDELVATFDISTITPDPLQLVLRYADPLDQETAGSSEENAPSPDRLFVVSRSSGTSGNTRCAKKLRRHHDSAKSKGTRSVSFDQTKIPLSDAAGKERSNRRCD